ncbi:M28 family metallopeptidase [Patulibacter defluvii]|uniref:M28 family metallopeptidase n=1 Tax=Patulibacter defluvii TaxID=3095358 RepID=UPI002A7476F2|nr:M28 family peptidase [Patulibacter sp. DM4]
MSDPLADEALIADVRRLAALGPRACGTGGEARARAILLDDLRQAGAARVRCDELPYLAYRPERATCVAVGIGSLPARGLEGTAAAGATGPGRFLGGGEEHEIAAEIARGGPLAGAVAVVRSDLLFPVAARLRPHAVAALVHVGSAPDGLVGAFTASFHPPPAGPPWEGRVLPFPGVTVEAAAGARLIERLADGAPAPAVAVEHGARYGADRTANVVAEIPGRGRERIVVGAHYDSQRDSPGASDNATGLSALLGLARWWAGRPARPRRTIELVAFAGEEPACWGSNHHARRCDPARTVAMVNLDALGPPLAATRTIVASPGIAALARDAAAASGWVAEEQVDAAAFPYADHAPFVDAGIDACWLWRWPPPHPYYHSPGDTPEHVDPRRLGEDARAAAAVIGHLADIP